MSKNKSFTLDKVILLLILFRLLFYHSDGAFLNTAWRNGSNLYVRSPNGDVYRASACIGRLENNYIDNYISFTAIGLKLHIGKLLISAPVIIHCQGSHMESVELTV